MAGDGLRTVGGLVDVGGLGPALDQQDEADEAHVNCADVPQRLALEHAVVVHAHVAVHPGLQHQAG
eukprot:5583897-Pyramimonas_sp.AAC.1